MARWRVERFLLTDLVEGDGGDAGGVAVGAVAFGHVAGFPGGEFGSGAGGRVAPDGLVGFSLTKSVEGPSGGIW